MLFKKYFTASISTLIGLSFIVSAMATPDNSKPLSGLADRVFAVEAEILYTLDPASTGPVGSTFDNCYYFNEDGSWFDPLFPEPPGLPGVWIQHTELPKIIYTATVPIPGAGLLLIQNGTVNPSRGNSKQRLTAYTAVFSSGVPGNGLFVEVESRGRAVETCPFELPQPI